MPWAVVTDGPKRAFMHLTKCCNAARQSGPLYTRLLRNLTDLRGLFFAPSEPFSLPRRLHP